LLDYPTLLAHVNYCDDDELKLLSAGIASVVYCPRTHAYFGHPPHRWRVMLEAGINVAVGTDSTASSPDLNLLDDLRLLHQIAPETKVETLWEMATIRAARALQLDRHVGSLALGKSADFVLFPVTSQQPLTAILENHIIPSAVWIDGKQSIVD
jgi:aminodeoxyfutalosine deaminase